MASLGRSFRKLGADMIEITPELVCEVSDREFGLLGYLVVDFTINNMSWGA